MLVELADSADEAALNALLESVIGQALEDELCLDAVVSASLAQLQGLWKLREEISEAQRADGPHLKHDVSLPIERIPDFMASAQARLQAQFSGIRPFIFGHFGDGNLHYNLSRPAGATGPPRRARPSPTRCWTRSTDTVAASAPSTASASSSAITSCTARIRWSCG